MKRLIAIAVVALVSEMLSPARGAVTGEDLATVGIRLPAHAALPLELRLQGEDGSTKPLRFWLGATPSIWVLADYTCETLCGPVISIVSDALGKSGLRPGKDFRLIVVGLDPKDTAADAASMRQARIGGEMAEASYFLRGDAGAITKLTRPWDSNPSMTATATSSRIRRPPL